jgi:carotenoid cleavage dioxygenase-like enzyme
VGDPSGKWQLPTDISVRQPANTGVVDWAGRVLALYERDLPYELDGALRTLGTSKLGAWKGASAMSLPSCMRELECVVAWMDGCAPRH